MRTREHVHRFVLKLYFHTSAVQVCRRYSCVAGRRTNAVISPNVSDASVLNLRSDKSLNLCKLHSYTWFNVYSYRLMFYYYIMMIAVFCNGSSRPLKTLTNCFDSAGSNVTFTTGTFVVFVFTKLSRLHIADVRYFRLITDKLQPIWRTCRVIDWWTFLSKFNDVLIFPMSSVCKLLFIEYRDSSNRFEIGWRFHSNVKRANYFNILISIIYIFMSTEMWNLIVRRSNTLNV